MSNPDRLVTTIATAALFAALAVSPTERVHAATRGGNVSSITLKYAGAGLDAPPGVAHLYRRIHDAARTVCGHYDAALTEERALWNQCVDEAVAKAVSSVHSENLSAYHARHSGRRQPPLALAAKDHSIL